MFNFQRSYFFEILLKWRFVAELPEIWSECKFKKFAASYELEMLKKRFWR